MPATFEWDEANGAGQTLTHNVTQVNWKSVDDVATAYTSAPISDGTNSYTKWQYGHFSGTYNTILNGLWAHTAGTFGTGLTLYGAPSGASQLTYATPVTTDQSGTLTVNMTGITAIGSGTPVYFGATSANTAGKTTSTTANPAYTNYLTTQLQANGATAGDTATVTITLQYDEN